MLGEIISWDARQRKANVDCVIAVMLFDVQASATRPHILLRAINPSSSRLLGSISVSYIL